MGCLFHVQKFINMGTTLIFIALTMIYRDIIFQRGKL